MKLKIKIGNIEFEADGNEEEVRRERTAMTEFLEHLATVNSDMILPPDMLQSNNEEIVQQSIPMHATYQSFNEFLQSISVKNDTSTVMAAAYFLYKYHEKDCFTSKDIEELLTESHIKRPGNISQAIAQNIKKGLIAQNKKGDSQLKIYQVLTTAEDWYNNVKIDKSTV